MKLSKKRDLAWYQIHRSLFATIIGVFIVLITVSQIDRTLQYYWCLAGLASASCYAFRRENALAKIDKGTSAQLAPKRA